MDSYDFRVVDKNATSNTEFPKSFGIIGISEDKKSIAYLYFYDKVLDYIGEYNEKNTMKKILWLISLRNILAMIFSYIYLILIL